ncbi:hypothetical protein [Nocardia rhamnosiphila]
MAFQNHQAANIARGRRAHRNTLIIVGVVLGLLGLCGGNGRVVDDSDGDGDACEN